MNKFDVVTAPSLHGLWVKVKGFCLDKLGEVFLTEPHAL